MVRRKLISTAWLVFASAACAGNVAAEIERTVSEFSRYVSIVDPVLRAAYEAELRTCPDTACRDDVERRWQPVIEISQRVRAVWCELKQEDC